MFTPNRYILKTAVLVGVALACLIFLKDRAPSIRVAFLDSVTPILASSHAVIAKAGAMLPFASLRDENRFLRARVDSLTRTIREMEPLGAENRRLRDLLAFKKTVPYTTVAAQVIGRDPSNWSNVVIIDKGMGQGVKNQRAVLSVKGLVGRLVEVGRSSSKILLITDPNSRVGVVIARNRQGGILVGRPDGTCKMIYISLDSDVSPGDWVITAGFGTVFPKDILVGKVIKVDKEPGRLYKYALVRPMQDLSKLEEVLCIR